MGAYKVAASDVEDSGSRGCIIKTMKHLFTRSL